MKNQKKYMLLFYISAVLIMAGAIIFSQQNPSNYNAIDSTSLTYVPALVLTIIEEDINVNEEGIKRGMQEIEVEILKGTHKGVTTSVTNTITYSHSVYVAEGQKVIVCIDHPDENDNYIYTTVYSYARSTPIFICVVLFLLLLILLGGKTGARSAFGLIFTFVMILFLLIPLVTMGYSPVLTSGCIIVLVGTVSLISLLGFTKKTIISIIGVSTGLLLCCLLFFMLSAYFRINGYSSDEIETLIVISQSIDLKIKDLLFTGILISSFGAIMDIAVSIASSITELHELNPDLDRKALFQSGFRIGRDITGTMTNTLILAFAGGFFITLFLCRVYNISFTQFINMNSIAIEIAQALSATAALALTTPFTAYAASCIYRPKDQKS